MSRRGVTVGAVRRVRTIARTARRTAISTAVVGVAAIIVAAPASAAPGTVTALALSPDADCRSGKVDVSISSEVPAVREHVVATTRGSAVPVTDFEQTSGVGTSYSGSFSYPFTAPLPEGTVVALYAYVGDTPPSADTTAEFFLLYECRPDGASVTLATCMGPYGTCPDTARAAPRITAAPAVASAGTVIVVSGVGCYADSVYATASSGGGAVAETAPVAVGADGVFALSVAIPAVVSGPTEIAVSCGVPAAPVSDDAALVAIDVTPSETVVPTTPPPTGTPSPTASTPSTGSGGTNAPPLVIPKFTG